MPDLVPIRRALLSVSDKTDLLPFARRLADLGVELISTGGTAAALRKGGLAVRPVEHVTGFPEIMDGRVKTLHPLIHGGLLARRDLPAHVEAMQQHGIEPIDLVCISLYPFEQTIRTDGVSVDEAIEQIDIGGPAMLRSAAKNHEFVTVVTSASQYDKVVTEIRSNDGATTMKLRQSLAAAAFARTAEYDTTISAWMGERGGELFPELLQLRFAKRGTLRYGENPHQKAAVYASPNAPETTVVGAPLLNGRPLSYNNLLDGAAALQLCQDLHDAFTDLVTAVVVKHTNACGASVAVDGPAAIAGAFSGDPVAAYGGILACSATINDGTARAIAEGGPFIEVVVAPAFEDAARDRLAERWPNVRLLAVGPYDQTRGWSLTFRSVPGGVLVQEPDRKPANPREWSHAAGPEPDDLLLADATFAWTVVKHLKSNAIAIAAGGELLGGGPGQVDRVGAARLAVLKAGARLKESTRPPVAASDAFFPFPDGPALLADAGVRCIVQPGGSKRDEETIALCEERGVTCLLTGVRHFRH
ncbi:MAG: bifunctional phosphoribosylaminoimidazolecarboxamide formyltransferase/IMP cyclohydrolase [Planctomycetota bacterium]|jgi:phosphoribosylaminoimidazolecarboxamide formyltransferase/IMP cyclohydrolase